MFKEKPKEPPSMVKNNFTVFEFLKTRFYASRIKENLRIENKFSTVGEKLLSVFRFF